MKLTDKLIRFGLVAMIILSLFLSWKIWTNSGNQEIKKQAVTDEKTLNYKKAKDVFLPVKLIYHTQKGEHLYTNKESLILSVTKELLASSTEKISRYSQKNVDKYFATQTKRNSFELVMSASLPLAYFAEINGVANNLGIEEEMMFERIVVAIDEHKVYFLNDEDRQVYQMPYKNNLRAVESLLTADGNRFLEVIYDESELPIFYSFKEDLRLKKYSYILVTQSYTTFSQAFFGNNQEVFSSDDNQESKDVNLLNAEGGSLNVKYATGEVYFSGRFDPEIEADPSKSLLAPSIFSDTFTYVEKIGNSMGTLRYFEGNGTTVVYRNYVEGFPIFSDYSRGRLEITKNNLNSQIWTNQETIQVPIPSDEEIVLENTEKIVGKLLDLGIERDEIQDLQIGYTWQANQETKQVVDLVPEWYVKYQDQWLRFASLVERAGEK